MSKSWNGKKMSHKGTKSAKWTDEKVRQQELAEKRTKNKRASRARV